MKREWLTMGDVVGGLFTRAGLAYGPVQKATVGHPQYQYLTVFGRAVNAAVNLCENATRDRNVVVVDQLLFEEISKQFHIDHVASDLGKASNYTSAAYEVKSISNHL